MLVRGGFDLETIKGFTLAQVRGYSVATERARKRTNQDLLVMLRGAQYDQRNFEKLMDALEQ